MFNPINDSRKVTFSLARKDSLLRLTKSHRHLYFFFHFIFNKEKSKKEERRGKKFLFLNNYTIAKMLKIILNKRKNTCILSI